MDFSDYLAAIRRESLDLASAARLGLEPDVPNCPGWTVANVVGHTGMVHRHKERIVREGWQEEPESEPPPEKGLIEWFEEGAEQLLDILSSNHPSTPVYTWYPPDRSVGFWLRRMARETAVHRVDAQLGHGSPEPVDPSLAADGIDEILRVMMVGYPDWAQAVTTDRTVRLVCTNRPGAWTLRFITWTGASPRTGTAYDDEPGVEFAVTARPDSVLQAPANDLLLFLWGRGPASALRVDGDASVIGELRSIAATTT